MNVFVVVGVFCDVTTSRFCISRLSDARWDGEHSQSSILQNQECDRDVLRCFNCHNTRNKHHQPDRACQLYNSTQGVASRLYI